MIENLVALSNLVLSTDIAALSDVWNSVVQKWVGPAVFIVIGAVSLKFLFSREWSKFISFLALGVIVAVIIYVAPNLFGQNSDLVKSVGGVAKQIN